MAWKVEFSSLAQKNLEQLDPQIARRIFSFMRNRVANLDNPRSIGEPLKGSRLGEFWKYRVGDWRIIASIEDDILRVIVVRIGNRREVYRSSR
ncbi:MAG: type II toxin-antitoxin system RelE/ParE family toxin [Syntrophorhabdaceae bacterium]|nr:type II toxin-antitoxin system RelE/ParE family toxin [Syntrophorhabdaceae bacterium]